VSKQAASAFLDPARAGDSRSCDIYALLFDRLVSLDDRGRLEPALAVSWKAEEGNQPWQFPLRNGVSFSDGTALDPEAVAASLRAANPTWKVIASADSIVIERDRPDPDLPAELALCRNSIVKRNGENLIGSGPFVVSQWQPRKLLTLTSRNDYWGGQPFLASIEISFGVSLRDQLVAFDLGKTQIAEVAPEQSHTLASEGRRIESSLPSELLALVFVQEPKSPEEAKLREALSLSIDRGLLNRVVLQNGGEPTGGLLPAWMTGYTFLFPTDLNLTRAQQLRAEVPQAPLWKLGFDSNDPVEQLLAERIVLNARDSGLRLQLDNQSPDVKLVRLPLPSRNPRVALKELAAEQNLPPPMLAGTGSVEELYVSENALIAARRVIPLLHLRTDSAVSKAVKYWSSPADGNWRFDSVWLSPEQR